MSSDHGGQEYFLASPSLVSPQSLGDCRGQRGTTLLPCISSFNSKSILRHTCRNSPVLSLVQNPKCTKRAAQGLTNSSKNHVNFVFLGPRCISLRRLASKYISGFLLVGVQRVFRTPQLHGRVTLVDMCDAAHTDSPTQHNQRHNTYTTQHSFTEERATA